MIFYVNEMEGTVDVLWSPLDESEPVGEPTPLRKAHVNPALFDIHFAGTPVMACSPEVCDYLKELFDWRKFQNPSEAGRYKYVLDVSQSAGLNIVYCNSHLSDRRKRMVGAFQAAHHVEFTCL